MGRVRARVRVRTIRVRVRFRGGRAVLVTSHGSDANPTHHLMAVMLTLLVTSGAVAVPRLINFLLQYLHIGIGV